MDARPPQADRPTSIQQPLLENAPIDSKKNVGSHQTHPNDTDSPHSRADLTKKLEARKIRSISYKDDRVTPLDNVYETHYKTVINTEGYKPPNLVVSCRRSNSYGNNKGWGDLAFGRKISEAMLRRFPSANINLICSADIESHQRRIADEILDVKGVTSTFIDENLPHGEETLAIRKAAQEANVIVIGPSSVVGEIAGSLKDDTIHITEYAKNTCMNSPRSEEPVVAGIFGAGVFVESKVITTRAPTSKVLRKYVGNTIDHCGFEIPKSGLYFTYNSTDPIGLALAIAEINKNKPDDMKLVCRLGREDKGQGLLEDDNDIIFLENLGKKGIEKVVVIHKGVEKVHYTGALSSEGKTLYLIDPFPLTDADIHLLVDGSGPLIGTTGDISLSEVISGGKFPIPHRNQKIELKEDFERLIPAILGEDHPLSKYLFLASTMHSLPAHAVRSLYKMNPDCDMGEMASGIAELLENEETQSQIQEGIHTVLGVLRNHYNLEKYLGNQVCKTLLHQQHPILAEFHEKLMTDSSLTLQEKTTMLSGFLARL